MTDDLVKVKIKAGYPNELYAGLCGFYIKKGEIKKCPKDVFLAGSDALENVEDKPKQSTQPQINVKPLIKPTTAKTTKKTSTTIRRPSYGSSASKKKE